jgi:GlcNAc-P-P-Und epimerase
MKILVTGGSGFIGSRLVAELLEKGHEVRIFDKVLSSKYPELCHVGDIRDQEAINAALSGRELVYHLAAEHKDDVRPLSLYYEVNVGGAQRIAAACSANGVSRLVFTSSVAIYGLNAGSPSEGSPANPFNDYGRSKYQAEDVFRSWAAENPGVSVTIVRPTVVFGEGNRGNVYNLVRQIASGRFVMVGDGNNQKSMAYVGNIAAFLSQAVQPGGSGVAVFNYVDKPDLSMNELVGSVRGFMGKSPASFLRIPYWIGLAGGACLDLVSALTGRTFPISRVRVRKFCADTTISVEALGRTGFQPPLTLSQGMDRFLNHEFGRKQHYPAGGPALTGRYRLLSVAPCPAGAKDKLFQFQGLTMAAFDKYQQLIYLIKSDLFRYAGETSLKAFASTYIREPGFNVLVWMRLRSLVQSRVIGYILFRKRIRFGIDIQAKQIGSGFYIGHFGQIFVHNQVVVGKNCNISQGVTIGVSNRGKRVGVPTIGDCVYIAPGAKIFGGITIGDNVAIGANSVVNDDIPDNAVVIGIPAKVVSYNGSNGFIHNVTGP